MKGLFQVCESIEQEGEVREQMAKSYTIPVYKGKGDILMVDKHRGGRLLEQDMKVYEKTLEKRLRDIVKINEKQLGFQPGKSTVKAIFVLRQLLEKFGAKKKELFLVFVAFKKAFDFVPLEAIGASLSTCYGLINNYTNARSRVRTLPHSSAEFGIGVGVHQGSALRPLLFVVVMQEATKVARDKGLWDLLYADDLVIIAESEEEAVRKFGVWKREIETRGLKVNINKTKLMVMGREPFVKLQRRRYPCGVWGKGVIAVKGGATRDNRGSEI